MLCLIGGVIPLSSNGLIEVPYRDSGMQECGWIVQRGRTTCGVRWRVEGSVRGGQEPHEHSTA